MRRYFRNPIPGDATDPESLTALLQRYLLWMEEERLPRHALSQSEVEAVLAQADLSTPFGLRNRAILETLYSTGLRREEVLSLQLSDLDRHRSVVLVRRGKGNKDRFVPIGARALAWIDKYLADVRPHFVPHASTPTLFLTRTGRPMHPNQLSAQVRDYLEGAGIDKQGACHLLRHTAATLMLEGGADVRYIQAMLGHVSLATTQIYTHVSIVKLREVHQKTHPARLYRTPAEQNPQSDAKDGDAEDRNKGPDDDDTAACVPAG